MRILLILFLLQNFIIYKLDAKLIYNCKSVHFSAEKYKDINVVFMTGYEILENMPDKNKSIVKSKKYAMVLISEEKMMIVELDEPTINSKSAIRTGVADLNQQEANQEDDYFIYDAMKMEDLANQETNQEDDSFYHEYKTNCRLEFTKSCLKDSGNTILYGRDLENKYIVTISPNEYIF